MCHEECQVLTLVVLRSYCVLLVDERTTDNLVNAVGRGPTLGEFFWKATDVQGKTIAGIAGATFAIYKDQYEGAPL